MDSLTVFIKSNDRVDKNSSVNDAKYNFDFSSVLGQSRYKLSWSLISQSAGFTTFPFVEVQPLPPPTIMTFLSSGTFTLTSTKTVNYFIAAGGGGGGDNGDYASGGGGAGGYRLGFITVDAGSYSVVVGSGGLGGTDYNTYVKKNGDNSSFNGIIANGGGGCECGYNNDSVSPHDNGVSGGVGSSWRQTPANGIDGQGFAGGIGGRAVGYRGGTGGGGGGATTKGSNAVQANGTGSSGGAGGLGILIDSSNLPGYDSSNYFCGGGGGGNRNGPGGVGTSGGGTGAGLNNPISSGSPNTGGGGAGNVQETPYASFATPGGSGIVILTYTN